MKRSMMVTVTALFCLGAAATLAGGGVSDASEIRALRRKVAKLEKLVADLTKAVAETDKSLAQARKDAITASKNLKAVDSRFDKRTLEIARWAHTYHKREGDGAYHRERIKRIK